MLHGIAPRSRDDSAGRVRVYPHVSAFAIACAPWVPRPSFVSAVGAPPEVLARRCSPAGASWPTSPAPMERAAWHACCANAAWSQRVVVLGAAGGGGERVSESTAAGGQG